MIRSLGRLIPLLLVAFGTLTVAAQESIAIPSQITLVSEQIAAQPDDFSVACMPMDNPAEGVLYNNQAFPLASVSKLLIFLEYARRVDSHLIALDETVSVAVLERYNLPRTDRGAHDRFMETYPPGTITLRLYDVAANGMIQYSSNAAADYLLDRMAPIEWDSLFSLLSLSMTSVPHPLTMIPLLMNNHQDGQATMLDVEGMSTDLGTQYLNLYVQNEVWRQAEIDYRSSRRRSFPDWRIQSAILQQHTAGGSVQDFINILYAIYADGGPLPPGVKTMTRAALRWRDNGFIDANYAEYGSKLGFYSGGVMTLAAYGRPINGKPVISVTFFRDIPQRRYQEMLREDTIGEFAHWMNFNACAGLSDLVVSAVG
jgi:D-alanyl-D-alanine carboxypeptidase